MLSSAINGNPNQGSERAQAMTDESYADMVE